MYVVIFVVYLVKTLNSNLLLWFISKMSTKGKESFLSSSYNEINAWFKLVEFARNRRNMMFFKINQ